MPSPRRPEDRRGLDAPTFSRACKAVKEGPRSPDRLTHLLLVDPSPAAGTVIDDPAPAEVARPCPARPEDEREQYADDSDHEQDVPDRVQVDARGGDVHGPGEDRPDRDE